MLWLAIHPPLLSLEAFCAGLPPGRAGEPVALLQAHEVQHANTAAQALGVAVGQRRATALALAPDLLIGQADPTRDHQALHALAHAALAFTPMVALHGPADEPADTVLLEVAASLRYFGGAKALLRKLRAALAPLGHATHIAAAPTALGAALLARWRTEPPSDFSTGPHSTELPALQRLLNQAPVHLLAPAQHEALRSMGVLRLGELQALPRAGVAQRFGPGLLQALDRATGRRADPRTPLVPPPEFSARLELLHRADTAEQVLHGAALLLPQLVAWARARQARVAAYTLAMHHEPRHREGGAPPATELAIDLAAPSNDATHLQLLLRERLGRRPLPAPTLELSLRCHALAHSAAPSGELFPNRQGESENFTRLLERLQARLTPANVHSLQALQDHRPERARQSVPAVALRLSSRSAALPAPSTLPLAQPLWLLPEPQPLAEREELPLWQGRPLQLLQGPERIETGWWDGGLALRDYFIAQDAAGALLWVFRTRHPPRWFLHGRYA